MNETVDTGKFNKCWYCIYQLAEENGKMVRRRESMHGHVYYYNFEEMNYPPPCAQAKGVNEFRF